MYKIKQVSRKLNISEHTLRFWENNGFFPFIQRDENNVRLFTESDIEWVKLVYELRSIGVELKDVKRYIELCLIGDSTIIERYEIIRKAKLKLSKKLKNIQEQLQQIESKEKYYEKIINNSIQDCLNPMNNDSLQKTAV